MVDEAGASGGFATCGGAAARVGGAEFTCLATLIRGAAEK
jgi:hypothetical protein